jgi:hypothetical protein
MTTWVPPTAADSGDGSDPGDPEPAPSGEDEPESSDWSPDRLDAMVFGVTDMLLGASAGTGKIEVADGRLPKEINKGAPAGRTVGPRIGQIPVATRQGRIAAQQMENRRHE